VTGLSVSEAAERLGFQWFPHQLSAFEYWQSDPSRNRMCVYYPTGTGKTETMLTCMAIRGESSVLVIAPPVTHERWMKVGVKLGLAVVVISHAMFRQKTYKVSRHQAMIVDEFHMLGGYNGVGWKKMARLTRSLQAPLIIGSATPNYNDAERVFCIAHVLDPMSVRGDYLQWLYRNCETEENPYARDPIVTGFVNYASAAEFLQDLEGVVYLPSEAPDILYDYFVGMDLGYEFSKLNIDHSRRRIMASQMEKKHRSRFLQIVDPATGLLRDEVLDALSYMVGQQVKPTMIFAEHSEVAKAVAKVHEEAEQPFIYIDGSVSTKKKQELVQQYVNQGREDFVNLIGTASIATGTDGIDKMTDLLVIIDDTSDDALREQLIGRILPRGADADYSAKCACRFTYND